MALSSFTGHALTLEESQLSGRRTSHSPYKTPVVAYESMSAESQTYWGYPSSDVDEVASAHHGASSERFIADPDELESRSRRSESPQTPLTPLMSADGSVRGQPRISYRSPVVIPSGAFHVYLATKCEFLEPPHIAPVDHPAPTFPCFRLFLGQIRFESTGAEVRWILRHLTGVTAVKVEPRGCGCFLAYFRTRDEMMHVKSLHKRLLFDHSGVWYARTEQQVELLHRYVSEYLAHIGRGFRLPKDTIVVEEEKMPTASKGRYFNYGAPVMRCSYVPPQTPQYLSPDYGVSQSFGAAQPRLHLPAHSEEDFFGF